MTPFDAKQGADRRTRVTDHEKVELMRDLVTAVVEATKSYNRPRGSKGKLAAERKLVTRALSVLLSRTPTDAEVDRVVMD